MKNWMYSFILVLILIPFVSATPSFGVYGDYFFDTAETERLHVYPYDGNFTATYVVGTNVGVMSNDSVSFYVDLANNESGDIPYFISVSNLSREEEYTISDLTNEDLLVITDTDLHFIIELDKFENHSAGETAVHEICAYVKKSAGSPVLTFFVGINDSAVYDIDTDGGVAVTSTSLNFVCEDVVQSYDVARNENSTEIFGFYCSNCGAGTRLSLGLDTDSFVNLSATLVNTTQNISEQIYDDTNNFMIIASHTEDASIFSGSLLWRDSFHVNISLFETYEDDTGDVVTNSYGNAFDYIYAMNSDVYGDGYFSDNPFIATLNGLPDFGADWDILNFASNNQVFHWSSVDDGIGQIKFYEAGNYSLWLRKVVQTESVALDEFSKPSFSNKDFDTSKLATLSLNGTSTSYDFLFSKLDVQKWEFYRNLLFYGFALIIWLFGVFAIAYFTGDLKFAIGGGLALAGLIFGGVGYIL